LTPFTIATRASAVRTVPFDPRTYGTGVGACGATERACCAGALPSGNGAPSNQLAQSPLLFESSTSRPRGQTCPLETEAATIHLSAVRVNWHKLPMRRRSPSLTAKADRTDQFEMVVAAHPGSAVGMAS
jgi:hypothetical protein